MRELWMLEDLEPWPDAPVAGTVCEPATYWASPAFLNLPDEVCSEIDARIEAVTVDGRTERIAHLGHGFTTIVDDSDDRIGDVTLRGCLVWDRYLWLHYRTRPTGRLRVVERRGHLARHEERIATQHPGWFAVVPDGPTKFYETGSIPADFGIQWNALVIDIEDRADLGTGVEE